MREEDKQAVEGEGEPCLSYLAEALRGIVREATDSVAAEPEKAASGSRQRVDLQAVVAERRPAAKVQAKPLDLKAVAAARQPIDLKAVAAARQAAAPAEQLPQRKAPGVGLLSLSKERRRKNMKTGRLRPASVHNTG